MEKKKQQAYKDLRFRIITHNLGPGEIINEKDLMGHYGLGRTPLRDVLILLEKDGLINRYPRLGTFVAPLDIHQLQQVVEIRPEMEQLAVRLACRRIKPEQLDKLCQLAARADKVGGDHESDQDLLTHGEFDFHNLIYASTQNQKLEEILHELHGISARFWHYLISSKEDVIEQLRDIAEIAAAFEKKDEERACEVIRKHVHWFTDKIKARMFE